MQIERVSVDSLVFDPVNARKHSKRNLDAIKGSLAKFGQQFTGRQAELAKKPIKAKG